MTGKPSKLYNKTHPDRAPSQKLGYTTDLPLGQDRYERAACRLAIKLEAENETDDPHADDNQDCSDNDGPGGISVQTELTSSDIIKIEEDRKNLTLQLSAKEKEMEESDQLARGD